MGRLVSSAVSAPNPGISDTKIPFGTGNYRIFSSSCQWTVPNGVGAVRVTLQAGGGGAGGHWISAVDFCGYAAGSSRMPISLGAPGGGGGYGVGISQVTPGCVCCIVVGGGGGTASTVCSYWQNALCYMYCGNCYNCGMCSGGSCCAMIYASQCCCGQCVSCGGVSNVRINNLNYVGALCASSGSCGGYSCAFGFCALGGGGGAGGSCGTNMLCAICGWSVNAYSNTACTAGGIGGVGPSGAGVIASYCGGAAGSVCSGTTTCLLGCNSCYSCCLPPINAESGAAGSPLGHAIGACIPDLFSSAAFDGSNCSEDYLQLKYDLPNARWPGQIIYTQAAYNMGSNSVCCGGAQTRMRWNGIPANSNYYYYYCGGPSYTSCSTQAGLGGGGAQSGIATTYCASTFACYNIAGPYGSASGKSGIVIVEW